MQPVSGDPAATPATAARSIKPKYVWWGITAVVGLIVASFGGLRAAESHPTVTELNAGQTYHGNLFDIQVVDARIELMAYAGKAWGIPSEPGSVLAVVETMITNNGDSTAVPEIEGRDGPAAPDLLQASLGQDKWFNPAAVRRMDFATPLVTAVQPGLPTPVTFIWLVPRDLVAVGDTLYVRVNDLDLTGGDGALFEGQHWEQANRYAKFALRMGDSR